MTVQNRAESIRLFLTGGTLSAVRNAQGLLVPSTDNVQELAASLGYHDIVKPYTIDSIDFDIHTHYPVLRDGVIAALTQNLTAVICGGTDTLSWYASLLAYDLKRRGFLQVGSGQKIIVLSAMRAFQDAPQLVRNILASGKMVAADERFEGAFALSAGSLTDTTLDIHDATNQLDKISAELLNAFRSHAPVAFVKHGEIVWNKNYQSTAEVSLPDATSYARIAPPLLRGHSLSAICSYLECVAVAKGYFDGAMVECLPPVMNDAAIKQLCDALNPLQTFGVHITFCNPVRFSSEFSCMLPVMEESAWENITKKIAHAMDDTAVSFVTALPKDAYIRMVLALPAKQQPTIPVAQPAKKKQKFLGIRYVPHQEAMNGFLPLVAAASENILFSSLPGGVMPSAILPVLEKHAAHTRFWSMFDYEGSRYVDFDGRSFIESHKNNYAAGQDTAKLVQPYKS